VDAALSHYQQALEIRSRRWHSRYDVLLSLIHNNIGSALQRQGRTDDAIAHFQQSLEAQPDYLEANINLSYALLEKRDAYRALEVVERAIALQPDSADLHIVRGDIFVQQGSEARAVESYEQAHRLNPNAIVPLQNLASFYATSGRDEIRNGRRAVTLAERAVRLAGGENSLLLYRLAAAYAEAGDFPRAIETAQRALLSARAEPNAALVAELEKNIDGYRRSIPLRYNLTPQ
jgi:tetratricopeptide (TPR) repeat protein